MTISDAIVFIAALAALSPHIAALIVYDMILRRQYEYAREVWEERGREVGYNWAPPGTGVALRFFRIPGRQSLEWLSGTPDWAKPFPDVLRRLRVFRVLECVFIIELVVIVGIIIIVGR